MTDRELDAVIAEREACIKCIEELASTIESYKPKWWDWKLKLIKIGHAAAYKLSIKIIRARGE
jgi:hypothetical protein